MLHCLDRLYKGNMKNQCLKQNICKHMQFIFMSEGFESNKQKTGQNVSDFKNMSENVFAEVYCLKFYFLNFFTNLYF